MIEETYCNPEIAELLKEKEMDKECFTHYIQKNNSNGTSEAVTTCTQQMAMKWLRKNHQIFIRPNTSFLYPIRWYSEIFCYGDNLKTQQDVKTEYYDSPEQACEAAIKYCLEHLI